MRRKPVGTIIHHKAGSDICSVYISFGSGVLYVWNGNTDQLWVYRNREVPTDEWFAQYGHEPFPECRTHNEGR